LNTRKVTGLKLLVFSDSHGEIRYMRQALERERPDRVLHLGDVTRDADRLRTLFPDMPMEQVRGNCDLSGDYPEQRELLLGGRRLWMLHGHAYRVKLGLGALLSEARARGVDAVFFGHTHQPTCFLDGQLWVMNPGSCRGYPYPTCGIVELENGVMSCRTADI